MAHEFETCIGVSACSAEPALEPLSPSLSARVPLILSRKSVNVKKNTGAHEQRHQGSQKAEITI